MEKKAKNFDKIVVEWKQKIDSLQVELDQSQVECRSYSTELFKVKTSYEETMAQLDQVRRENKNLSNEIKDILDQLGDGGRSIHENDKIRKRLEAEKLELEAALSEAEGALEQEENKVLRAQLELTQVRQEIERRIGEKEEEFASTRKNFAKAIEGMQAALETETKGKVEALRMKKKLETDVCDLETALEHANAANMESQKNIKKIQLRLREIQARYEEESRAKEIARDNLLAADRRAHANENLGDQTCTNQAITGAKQKCENELGNLSHDLDEMSAEASMSEDKAQRAMVDAARLADELRAEQENAMLLERDRKLLEAQKNLRKSERRIKELTYQQDEDRKNHERMQALIDQLQGKIKSYKKQIEEAEEIAALNLAKFRQTQGSLADSAERCDLNEQALAKMRAKGRASSMGPM